MNGIKSLIILFSTIAIIASSCHKNNDPDPDSFYFRCKVDGQDYRPNGCTNCSVARLLGETTFLFNGNRGYESILIRVIKLDHLPIADKAYVLDQRPEQKGSYKNSTTVSDKYDTDSSQPGIVQITSLDKSTQTIKGTFSFQAFNIVQNKTISVADGKFRLKYTTH